MIGLDTNVLVRYYVAQNHGNGHGDAATAAQCEAARQLIDGGKRLMVSKTVVLELEWVLRGRYELTLRQLGQVFAHLLSLGHVQIEDRTAVQLAISSMAQGFDFADALHHASYRICDSVVTFDDKGFSRRAKKAGWKPAVQLLR